MRNEKSYLLFIEILKNNESKSVEMAKQLINVAKQNSDTYGSTKEKLYTLREWVGLEDLSDTEKMRMKNLVDHAIELLEQEKDDLPVNKSSSRIIAE